MSKTIDCIVCGSCVADVLVRPVDLDAALGRGNLHRCEPITASPGGIVSNAGLTLARLGKQTAVCSYVGCDHWGTFVRERYQQAGIATDSLQTHPTLPTSTSVVLINPNGQRSFLHSQGAPRELDRSFYLEQLDRFAASRFMLLGYFPLLSQLADDLPEVLAAIRATGCQTALDAAGDGGTLTALQPVLPELDIYVPSWREAQHQTGETDPRRIIACYREAGAPGIVGVKLGEQGALLSSAAGQYVEIAPLAPPGPVVDTTGAGDCFYGGLIAGLLEGLPLQQAGRLAAAAGACSVTGAGVGMVADARRLAGRR